jgi:hypothetical protein
MPEPLFHGAITRISLPIIASLGVPRRWEFGFDFDELSEDEAAILFKLVDTNPKHTFVLFVKDPRHASIHWPRYDNNYRPADSNVKMYLPNLWLGVRAQTADTLDKLEDMEALSEYCRGLVLDVRDQRELLDITAIPIAMDQTYGHWNATTGLLAEALVNGSYWSGDQPTNQVRFETTRFDLIICGGISQPIPAAWIQSLINQTRGTACKLWFDGWGDWVPFEHRPSTPPELVFYYQTVNPDTCFIMTVDGKNHGSPWSGWKREFPEAECMAKIGRAASGCLIDGKMYRELPDDDDGSSDTGKSSQLVRWLRITWSACVEFLKRIS